MNEDPEVNGFYWVRVDWGDGEAPPADWEPAEFRDRNWYSIDAEGVIYVAEVGPKLEPPK